MQRFSAPSSWPLLSPPSSRPRASLAAALALALGTYGCTEKLAPDEAPSLASSAVIPVAAPGATGVSFDSPRPLGGIPAQPTPVEMPTPLPTAESPVPAPPPEAAPSPFEQPSPLPSATPKKKEGGGAASGTLPKGMQL